MDELFTFFSRFMHLSEEARLALSGVCSKVSTEKNEILQDFGKTCKTIYFMRSGIARIFYYKDGNDITEYFAFEGDIIARAESLFTGRPSKKAIQILESADIIAISTPALFKLYDEYREIERLFRLIFESAYVDTINRIESIQFHSAEERYKALLEEPRIVQRIPLKHIASFLGITQVSLSRIRAAIK